jgi:glyceraldehyde-3-phosphate dehydrogenase/erythrose-4-phosphate dehydrogenase
MGRIGRRTQSNIGHTKFELVAVNDIVSAENIAYLNMILFMGFMKRK